MFRGILARKVTHVLFIVVLGALVYANSVSVPFNFDDTTNIVNNPIVKNGSYFTDTSRAAGLERYKVLRTRYVGYLTFFLNYRADGLDVTGYHLVNILIHLINALLVYALVVLTFRTPVLRKSKLFEKRHWVSLLAASLFVVHPVNTQAVTYIVQRLASLATLFYMGSMVCYIKSRLSEGKKKWFYYAGALVLAVLAMKTKENAFTLPLAMVLYEVMFFRGGSKKKRALLLVPFVLTMLIIPLTLVDLGRPAAQVLSEISEKTEIQHISRGEYLTTEMRVMATYLRLLVLPINQNLDYDYPLYSSITDGPVLGGLALVVLLIGLAAWLYRRREPAAKLVSFGIVFFFLALSVESSLVPLLPIYEHRLYLPGVGIMMVVSLSAMWVYERLSASMLKKVFTFGCVIMVLALGVLTVQRNNLWNAPVSLWKDIISKAPRKVRPHHGLAYAYYIRGQYDKAIKEYLVALSLDHDNASIHNELGNAYIATWQFDKAIEQYLTALKIAPDNASVHNNLGDAYRLTNQTDKAIEQLQEALKINPYFAKAHDNLGVIYGNQGKLDKAIEHFQIALKLDPELAEARYGLAAAYRMVGRTKDAEKLLER